MTKNCFSLVFLLLISTFLSSCSDKDEDTPARFSLDIINIEVISSGNKSDGTIPVITVVANNGYEITSDSQWLSVDKPNGRGRNNVTVLVDKYETGVGRTGHLIVSSGSEFNQEVTIHQSSTPFPAYGYSYFKDDFEWMAPYAEKYGAGNAIGDKLPGATAPNIRSLCTDLLSELTNRGYLDTNPASNTLYLQGNYLKFGKTSTLNGLILPAIDLSATNEKNTTAELSFDWSVGFTGSYNPDLTVLQVSLSGSGNIVLNDGTLGKKSDPIKSTQTKGDMRWLGQTITLSEISSDTRITIQPVGDASTQRYFIDNISIVKVPSI